MASYLMYNPFGLMKCIKSKKLKRMNKLATFVFLLLVGLLGTMPLHAQNDLLKGIFEKEAPVFTTTVIPTQEKGKVRLAVYFTHSKLNELEISFWIKDMGTLLTGKGSKQLVRSLGRLGNRQQDTITISGLREQHVYTIGADFRRPKSLSAKFSSQELKNGYRYAYREPSRVSTARVVDAMSKSSVPSTPVRPTVNCEDPIIEVKIDAAGYCGTDNRPAVLVQCVNCQGKEWEFSVEVRSQKGPWMPLRYDGKRQPAVGMSLRTEPLCTLLPGSYQVQVWAWGQGCPNPIVKSIPTVVTIVDPRTDVPVPAMRQSPAVVENTPKLPDTCFVEGQAMVKNKTIDGALLLSPFSPCADMRPYAEIVYVHPGHRNITLDKLPLIPGAKVPFSIPLDERDLGRGIHTIQVVAFVQEGLQSKGVPLESFWLRAYTPEELSASSNNSFNNDRPVPPPASPPSTDAYGDPEYGQLTDFNQSNSSRKGVNDIPPSNTGNEDVYIDPSLMESTISEVQVTATDPNCTPVQDLRVVFDSNQPTKPLFMSWLNPRCCQVEGCNYTVWAGPDPKQLSLLTKGKKAGAIISEVLHGTNSRDQYYEVVVETGNGVRKAAYALGVGPLYGIEEISDYHDYLYPPVPARVEGIVAEQPMEDAYEVESAVLLNPVTPQLPISDFETCKYQRKTTVIGEQPAIVGDEVTIKYNFNDNRYQYTLYHQPVGMEEWVIAPGTTELQSSSSFKLKVEPYHAGKYLILTYKPSSGGNGWGCLSAPLEDAVRLEVSE